MKPCPFCAEEIQDAAIVCKHCGRDLETGALPTQPTVVMQAPPQRLWSPGVAALLSLIIPGAGQMYKGQVINGLAWLFVVIVGYVFFVIPGVVLHLCCIIGASMGNPYPPAAVSPTGGAAARDDATVRTDTAAAAAGRAVATAANAYYGCPSCGKTVRRGDPQCKHCGRAL